MLNIKVFSVRDILRKLIFTSIIIVAIYFFIIMLAKFINVEDNKFELNIIEDNIKSENSFSSNDLYINILQNELGISDKFFKKEYIIVKNDDENVSKKQEMATDKRFIESGKINTWDRPKRYEVAELASGKVQVGNTYITNYSKLKLNLDELSKVSDFPINKDTSVLIFHTHTSEAYSEMGTATNFRTTDDSYNMVSVGSVLKNNLLKKNFDVKHITTKHDTPSYNGAYKASLESVQNEFKEKKYDIVLDVHRDALSGNLNYRPTAEINGESAAKLMFVVGTNAAGVQHDRWMENLKLALLIQNTANEMYPGLFRDLNLSKSRYNQHVCDGALIVEVGATGNTLEEAWTSMKYLANVIEALKN